MLGRFLQVLLIEDSAADIELTREAIRSQGYPVHLEVRTSGEHALEAIRSGSLPSPDLVLLDLNLPGMDGREVLERLKADPTLRRIPVVVLTSSEADFDISRCYGLGANSYVSKPTDFADFSRLLGQIVNFWTQVARLPDHEAERGGAPPLRAVGGEDSLASACSRILLVEDEVADAELLRGAMERVNRSEAHPLWELDHVARMEDALARFKSVAERFELVLLDLSLPDSSGFSGLLRIRKAAPDSAVVVFTGSSDRELGREALRLGAQEFIVKGEITDAYALSRIFQHAIERRRNELREARLRYREREALRAAENALALRDEFLSIASHELRTPLTALTLTLQLLDRELSRDSLPHGDELERFRSQLKRALEQIEEVNRLVSNLLDLSRIQAGRGRATLEVSRTDLGKLIRKVASHFEGELARAGCVLKLELAENLQGRWDPLQFGQVLSNLLGNAFKYAPGAAVEVQTRQEDKTAVIEVRDHGPGIAPEHLARIFDKFERGRPRAGTRGLGLGLYISRQIVEAHGGRIEAISQPGQGTTFRVTLPLHPSVERLRIA